MESKKIEDITIRTELKPTDLAYVVYKQAELYSKEYGYGIAFESYAFAGMHEFYENYDPEVDRVWICEDEGKIIGFLSLMHRENKTAQLRYFYLDKEYRGLGLGKKLMELYIEFLKEKEYQSSYLWTAEGLNSAISLYSRFGFDLTQKKLSITFGKPIIELRYDLSIYSPARTNIHFKT